MLRRPGEYPAAFRLGSKRKTKIVSVNNKISASVLSWQTKTDVLT